MHGPGSEEHLEGQLYALSISTLQTVKNVSVYISQSFYVTPVMYFKWRSEVLKGRRGEVDDLLGAVSKLSLCPLTRSAVGVCLTISGRRGHSKFTKTMFRSRF